MYYIETTAARFLWFIFSHTSFYFDLFLRNWWKIRNFFRKYFFSCWIWDIREGSMLSQWILAMSWWKGSMKAEGNHHQDCPSTHTVIFVLLEAFIPPSIQFCNDRVLWYYSNIIIIINCMKYQDTFVQNCPLREKYSSDLF